MVHPAFKILFHNPYADISEDDLKTIQETGELDSNILGLYDQNNGDVKHLETEFKNDETIKGYRLIKSDIPEIMPYAGSSMNHTLK